MHKRPFLGIGVTVAVAMALLPAAGYCRSARPLPGARPEPPGRGRGNPGPMSPGQIRRLLRRAGGKVVPLAKDGFFLQWFPKNWKSLKTRRIVVSLHGSGGHAERMFNLWYRNRSSHDYAIVAPQYAAEDEQGNTRFQDCREIYRNLRLIVDHLGKTGLRDSRTVLILHGFSRGAARVFELAALDRAADGMHAFGAFIADSGTSLAEHRGRISPFLRELPRDAYAGARFWLYSGTGDHGGRTCGGMRRMREFITDHGGKVDALFTYDTDRHGILITGGPRRESRAITALFAYINGVEPMTKAAEKKPKSQHGKSMP